MMKRDVKGFEGFYIVKENGDVYSVDRIVTDALGKKKFF